MRAQLEPGNNLIFVSIASYRDRQLVPTVEDLISKAREPDLLRFGICWQCGSDDPVLPFADDARFQILEIDWRSSKGACWARAEAMKLWRGEEWYLQIDSHCRFIEDWDEKLLASALSTKSSKPVLSTYGSPFTPSQNNRTTEVLVGPPQIITISRFTPDGIPELRPLEMPHFLQRTTPMAARFLAGGFLFAPGSFVVDVPYDPSLYFLGEESSMSVRAFTSGYDLFHPAETIVWHDYGRHDALRHWQDHDAGTAAEEQKSLGWANLDLQSRARVRALLTGTEDDRELCSKQGRDSTFGLGYARSLADFEEYAGVKFQSRRIHDHARLGFEPPGPLQVGDWASQIYTWAVRVKLDPAALGRAAFEERGFWMVLIEDEYHQEIFRQDFTDKDLQLFSGREQEISLICEFEGGIIPAFWAVWPHSSAKGWGLKLTGRLLDDDYAIIKADFPEDGGQA